MRKKQHRFLWIQTFIIVVGILFLTINLVGAKRTLAFDYMNRKYFEGSEAVTQNNEVDINTDIIDTSVPAIDLSDQEKEEYYIGYLEIPKIGLQRGFVDIDSPDNTVEKNVQIIESSYMPNVDRGNFILAAHSGPANISYFDDLYQLVEGDEAIVSYNNMKYIYKIVKIYTQPKVGQVAIYRDEMKTTLTLVTCTNHDNTTQTIYIAELTQKIAE